MKEIFLSLVRKYRGKKELSEKSGVPITTINNWLYCGVDPSLSNVERVLSAMGYSAVICFVEKDKEEK